MAVKRIVQKIVMLSCVECVVLYTIFAEKDDEPVIIHPLCGQRCLILKDTGEERRCCIGDEPVFSTFLSTFIIIIILVDKRICFLFV